MNDFPHEFEFSTVIPVCIEHINYGNHLGNDKVVSLLHEARVRYLKSKGKTEGNILVTHLEVKYRKEAFHGDELSFHLHYTQTKPCSGVFYYNVMRDKEVVIQASTKIAFFDYQTRKIVKDSL